MSENYYDQDRATPTQDSSYHGPVLDDPIMTPSNSRSHRVEIPANDHGYTTEGSLSSQSGTLTAPWEHLDPNDRYGWFSEAAMSASDNYEDSDFSYSSETWNPSTGESAYTSWNNSSETLAPAMFQYNWPQPVDLGWNDLESFGVPIDPLMPPMYPTDWSQPMNPNWNGLVSVGVPINPAPSPMYPTDWRPLPREGVYGHQYSVRGSDTHGERGLPDGSQLQLNSAYTAMIPETPVPPDIQM